jgi:K+-transporting ATPase KdpF subunit
MHSDWISVTGLVLSILLLVYLTISLLFPEKF